MYIHTHIITVSCTIAGKHKKTNKLDFLCNLRGSAARDSLNAGIKMPHIQMKFPVT